ncbi:unnamed protein product [Kuraishia capsulata CBS 1993]|uniref:Chromatin assembly factor 1 subunit A dimerization domain-containing protein n=1 Tax=Kuraishia capsulata CBS 1993 TaxID=1382522 RepID=W6MKR2_9ASCO|nr:uncharacterized protein KUCA_T00002591001 [Kuraishia capsulata CBS 1993]CDK26618.1 unnamed protein product [Kuraishia capsulata CBS 1993]
MSESISPVEVLKRPLEEESQDETALKKMKIEAEKQERLDKKLQLEKERLEKRELLEKERLAKKELLEREKQERLEKKLQLDLERQQKKEQIEREKQQKREQLELERLQKKEQLELEKTLKRQKLEKEKQEREERKLEEKRLKDIKREEEKLEREKKKEEERLAKEAKEAKKREEEEKKKRAQLSIGSFFKPISSSPLASPIRKQEVKTQEASSSDYEKHFLKFYVKENCQLCGPVNLDADTRRDQFSLSAVSGDSNIPRFFKGCQRRKRGAYEQSSRSIMQQLNVDQENESLCEQFFKDVPIRFLQFYENARPPYFGTYSPSNAEGVEKLALNPFLKIEGTNYQFDSDLESDDEDDEGEDVEDENDEDDDDESAADSDELDEFVDDDDENSTKQKRKLLGPLIPVVKWLGDAQDDEIYNSKEWERLSYDIEFPIDPFKDYWTPSLAVPSLAAIGSTTAASLLAASQDSPPKKALKVIDKANDIENLSNFILENPRFTIGTLTELCQVNVFKDQRYSKTVVRNSIQNIASFDSKKKLWILKDSTNTAVNSI